MVLAKTCAATAKLPSSARACKARRVKVSQPRPGICSNAGKPQNTLLAEMEDAAKSTDQPYLEAPPHAHLLSSQTTQQWCLSSLITQVYCPARLLRLPGRSGFCTTASCAAVLQTLPSLSGKFSPVSCMQPATAKPHQKTASRPACARVLVTSL